MVNSEPAWKDVHIEIAKEYGHKFDEIVFKKMMGRKEDDAIQIFIDYFSLSESIPVLQKKRKEMVIKKIPSIPVNKGLLNLLDLLDKLHIKKAIATSAFSDIADRMIKHIGVFERFPVIVTGDMVINGKPNPEIYLKAAKNLGVDPKQTLVIEDAQNGVESGYNAGMKVIAIPHKASKHHDFSKATLILPSMEEITEDLLKSL